MEKGNDLANLRRLTLTERQRFDLEQILNGGFAPLTGYLTEEEYRTVVDSMRLPSGAVWPMPVVLDVPTDDPAKNGDKMILCDMYGNPIAYFTVTSIYSPDKLHEVRQVYGTDSIEHPGVRQILNDTRDKYLGGPVELIAHAPVHDFKEHRFSPTALKEWFANKGWKKIVAFQTRNPMHRAHYEIVRRAAEKADANVLLHPVVGQTKEGDIDYISRVRAYKRLVTERMKDSAHLALLPIAMRMAGPREAVWHALIRKNYGATHFIVGRDHAGPGSDSSGKPFYDPYAAQQLAKQLEGDLGIEIIPMQEMAYLEEEERYIPSDELKSGQKTQSISGTQFRSMLRNGEAIPEWFSFPEVVEELRIAVAKEARRGAVVFFTGLSGAGKSTIAHVLYHKLLERFDRSVTMLDGDVVRTHLSKGLGFSKEDRDANIERIGFVASEIAKHGGIAICAAIAPYAEARDKNRRLVSGNGAYVEVFVDAPLDVCEARDTKGLYKKARQGLLKQFTGVDDAYEKPEHAELTINSVTTTPETAAETIIALLRERGIV